MDRLSNKRIALVYDRVVKWGGAERVLLDLHQLFPTAELFAALHDPDTALWAAVFPKIHTSFLNNISLVRHHHEWFPWVMPLAFEQFNFDRFDLVISVTSAEAKGIITKPHTKHLCYCLTPTRYLYTDFYHIPRFAKSLSDYLKWWDQVACIRPDKYIAISQTIQARIKKYYHQDASVIYPALPFLPQVTSIQGNYFLIVSRLVDYKNLTQLVTIFNQLNLPLVIIGTGRLESQLKTRAKPNITFAGLVSDTKLASFYAGCRALIYFHEEDFGLVPLEAQSFGKPVLGLNRGGVAETVVHGKTGLLLDSLDSLSKTLTNFSAYSFDPHIITTHAQKFGFDRFQQQFLAELGKL